MADSEHGVEVDPDAARILADKQLGWREIFEPHELVALDQILARDGVVRINREGVTGARLRLLAWPNADDCDYRMFATDRRPKYVALLPEPRWGWDGVGWWRVVDLDARAA
jgi:hypothetical protein